MDKIAILLYSTWVNLGLKGFKVNTAVKLQY